MKKAFQLLLVLVLVQPLVAQEVQHEKKKRLEGFYVAPTFGLEFFSFKKYTDYNNGYSITYKGLPSMRMGFDLFFKHSDQLLFNGGLFFSPKSFTRTEVCEECATDYYYQSKFRYNFVEAAGGITYNFLTGRFDLGVYTNANLAILISAKETRDTEAGNNFVFNLKPTSNTSILTLEPGLNLNYNLTYRLSLGLKAGYRLYTRSFDRAETFKNNAFLVQPGLLYMF